MHHNPFQEHVHEDLRIAWSAKSESSKAVRFPSFHGVQNENKGAASQVFFLFFPTKASCQLSRASLTKEGITH